MFNLVELFNVQGLSVVITGGGTGLGLHMAKAFATNGAKVLITGRRQDALDAAVKEVKKIHDLAEITAVSTDVTQRDAVEKIINALGEEPQVDVLINNAAIARPDPPQTHETPLAELQAALLAAPHSTWTETFSTNVEAPFYLSVGLLHLLAASPTGGRIINISSIGGRFADPKVHQPAYQASKAAVDHLTHILASKLREHGVRVNAIAPGYFESAMNDPKNPNSMISKAKVLVPLKRGGNGTDIGGTALWLASPAGSYVDGQVIVLDGGRTWA